MKKIFQKLAVGAVGILALIGIKTQTASASANPKIRQPIKLGTGRILPKLIAASANHPRPATIPSPNKFRYDNERKVPPKAHNKPLPNSP